jgi:hypothetical protein
LPFLDVGAVLQRHNFQIVIATPQWKRSSALLTQKAVDLPRSSRHPN